MPLDDQELERTHAYVRRLHAPVGLTNSPAQTLRASRVAAEAVAALDVPVCIIHRLSYNQAGEASEPEMIALRKAEGLASERFEGIAKRGCAGVAGTRGTARIEDLGASGSPNSAALETGTINYLGVPIFDLKGAVIGTVAVLAGRDRGFDSEDEWWLQTAAQLTAASLTCEMVQERLRSLEQVLAPYSGGAAPQTAGAPPGAGASNGDLQAVISPAAPAQAADDKLSVLVIDDDKAVNKVVSRYLTKQGYKVDSAFDGLEAMRVFRPGEHDVVISDIAMPHMNGWELVAALRVRAPQLPVVLVTGYSSVGKWNQKFLTQQGVLAVLNKPFDMEHLASLLADVWRKKDYSRATNL